MAASSSATSVNSLEAVGLTKSPFSVAVDSWAQKWLDSNRVAGMAVAFSQKGGKKILHKATYGFADKEAQRPFSGDDTYQIASLTKVVVAVALMQLVEEGKVALEDPISKYVEEFKSLKGVLGADGKLTPLKREPTVLDAMRHTTGMAPYYFIPQLADGRENPFIAEMAAVLGAPTAKDFAKMLADIPFVHQPGEYIDYAVSVDLAGYVIEVVTGMPLSEYFEKNIFGPLGMKSTCFTPKRTEDISNRRVKCYTANIEAWTADPAKYFSDDFEGERMRPALPQEDLVFLPPVFCSGGGGLMSTVDDYMRFGECLVMKGAFPDGSGRRLLQESSFMMMTKDHTSSICKNVPPTYAINGTGSDMERKAFGIGVCVDKGSIGGGFFEWGGLTSAVWWADPRRELVAVCFTQLMNSFVYPFRTELKDIVEKYVPESLNSKL